MSLKKQALCLALLCAAAAVAMRLLAPADLLVYALALPFDWAGKGLRALSLSGPAGDVLGWALYTAACAAPLGQGLWMKARGRAPRRWWLRALLSGCLFFALYQFINPAGFTDLFGELAQGEGLLVAKAMAAGVCWSVAAAWWVLCMLGRAERLALFEGLGLLLKLTGALLIVGVCYVRLYALLGCFRPSGVLAGLYGLSGGPVSSLARLGTPLSPLAIDWPGLLRCLAGAIPSLYLLRLVPPALGLLKALSQDPYGEPVPGLCASVAAKARAAVYACLACSVGLNLIQLFFAGPSIRIGVEVPLLELFLALALLLLADGLRRNRALKLDNDAII